MGLNIDRIGYNNNVSPNIEPIINTLDAMIRRIVEKKRYKKKCEHVIRFLWTRTAHQNLEEGWLLCDSPSFTTSSFCQLCHYNQLKWILRLAASCRYLAGLCFVVNILKIGVPDLARWSIRPYKVCAKSLFLSVARHLTVTTTPKQHNYFKKVALFLFKMDKKSILPTQPQHELVYCANVRQTKQQLRVINPPCSKRELTVLQYR